MLVTLIVLLVAFPVLTGACFYLGEKSEQAFLLWPLGVLLALLFFFILIPMAVYKGLVLFVTALLLTLCAIVLLGAARLALSRSRPARKLF